MELIRYRLVLAGLLVFIFLSACAPLSEHYKSGLQLAQEKRWDEAITFFEKAIQEDPSNREKYEEDLQQARRETAKIQLERGRTALAAITERNIPALEQVFRFIDRANRLDPANRDIVSFHADIRGRIDGLNRELRSLYGQSEEDMKKEDWVAALGKLRRVNQILPNYEDTGTRLAKIRQEGPKKFYQQGLASGKQEDWKMAVQAFKTAVDLNPDYFDVAKLYHEALSRDNVDYFSEGADKAAKARDWEKAIMMYERAIDYQPNNQELARRLEVLKDRVGQIYLDEAAGLTRQNKFYPAFKRLELIERLTPAFQDEPAYIEFLSRFSAAMMQRADGLIKRDLLGNALVWLQRIESLRPNYPDLFQKMLEIKDQIERRIRRSIAVFDFGSPFDKPDAGKIVANKLIAFLHKNASGDLRIIERENLQSILREVQLGQAGVVDLKTAQTAKMKGIDTFIMGGVLSYSVRTTDNSMMTSVRVKMDEEFVTNHEFTNWKHLNPAPSREELLKAPPPTIKKTKFETVSYKKGTARITAMFETSYKLVDTATGENIATATVPGRLIKEDQYQDPVLWAGIPHDPLELPTEGEVLDELTTDKCSEIGRSILKLYQSLEVENFNQGELQRRRRNNELAIERYTDAIYNEKMKGISTPVTTKSLELIDSMIQGL